MWSKKDSLILESIEKSLRIIAEREQERSLVPSNYENFLSFFKQKKRVEEKEIAVHSGQDLEEIAEDELVQTRININNKLEKAKALGKEPFFIEDLLTAEELEAL